MWTSRRVMAGLILLLGLIVFPMAWVVVYSAIYSLGGTGRFSEGWTLRHWQAAISEGGLGESIAYSTMIAMTVTAIATIGAFAITLAQPGMRHSRWFIALLCVPLATPAAVSAVTAYQILNPGGFFARVCYHAGWIASPADFPVLVQDPYAIGIVLTQSSHSLPLLTLYLFNTWTTARIDRFCRLAQSLGATRWQALLQVALPVLLARSRPMILLTFLFNLGSYEIPLLLGRQAPQMFSVLTQRQFGQFDLYQRPQAFALATTYLLLVSLGMYVFLKWRRPHVSQQLG